MANSLKHADKQLHFFATQHVKLTVIGKSGEIHPLSSENYGLLSTRPVMQHTACTLSQLRFAEIDTLILKISIFEHIS